MTMQLNSWCFLTNILELFALVFSTIYINPGIEISICYAAQNDQFQCVVPWTFSL